MSDRIRVKIEAGVADVRLNRPEKLNALDGPMIDGLLAAGKELMATRGLRAVVISGEGRAFCAGLDFAGFRAIAAGDIPSGMGHLGDRTPESPANLAQRAAWIWAELPVLVIAAVHGVAHGGGLQIALAADLRIVAPDAQLSVREVQWGLIPDMTGTQTLRRLVRLDVAKELTYTGRVFSGSEAAALGLATRLSETPRDAAHTLARQIAAQSPDAVRAAKRLLDRSGLVGLEEGLQLEEQTQLEIIGRPNQVEAVMAMMEKRPPRFSD
jgi:enoyl-CoA hydratase/carnithine racemase